MARRLIYLLAVYLTLDVANPMMPGALVLSVADSVEVRMAPRLSVEDVAGAQAGTLECREPVSTLLAVSAPVVVRAVHHPSRTHAPRLHLSASTPAPPFEEH
jgi:hypothetical protein